MLDATYCHPFACYLCAWQAERSAARAQKEAEEAERAKVVQMQGEVKHWREKAQREEGSERDVLELLGALQMKEVQVRTSGGL